MRFLASYFMKGPKEAYLTAAALSVLTLWFAPLGFLLGAGIALVTLQVGIKEGLQVMLAAVLVHLGVGYAVTGHSWTAWVGIAEFMLPAWGLAFVLRQSKDLAVMIQWVVWLVGALVVLFHLAVPDTVAWWTDVFKRTLGEAMQQMQVTMTEENWQQLGAFATSMVAMSLTILWTSMLLFARWWQSMLYAPGKFQESFHNLALPRQLAWLTGLVALAGLIIGPQQQGLVSDLFAVLSAGLMFQGLAVIHALVERRQMSNSWLFAVYVFLFLFPQAILLLAILALMDIWLDLRQRYATPTN